MRRTRHPIAIFGFPSNVLDLRGLSLLSSFPTRERCLRSDANWELRAGADWLPRIGDFGRLGDSLSAGDPLVSHPIVDTARSRSHRAREWGFSAGRTEGSALGTDSLPSISPFGDKQAGPIDSHVDAPRPHVIAPCEALSLDVAQVGSLGSVSGKSRWRLEVIGCSGVGDLVICGSQRRGRVADATGNNGFDMDTQWIVLRTRRHFNRGRSRLWPQSVVTASFPC